MIYVNVLTNFNASWKFRLQPGPSQNCGEGYNSEDEYSHLGVNLTEEEWLEKDRKFERAMKKKGWYILTIEVEVWENFLLCFYNLFSNYEIKSESC